MQINQLSVFIENKTGRLMEIMDVLSANNIDISALSLADTTDFGVLRMIVNDPERAKKALKESGVIVKTTSVIALPVEDTPGGLAKVLSLLKSENVCVEYMYAFCTRTDGRAAMVLRVDDADKAQRVFSSKGLGDISAQSLFGKN